MTYRYNSVLVMLQHNACFHSLAMNYLTAH